LCSITQTNSPKSLHTNLQNNKPSQKQKKQKINSSTPLKHHAPSGQPAAQPQSLGFSAFIQKKRLTLFLNHNTKKFG